MVPIDSTPDCIPEFESGTHPVNGGMSESSWVANWDDTLPKLWLRGAGRQMKNTLTDLQVLQEKKPYQDIVNSLADSERKYAKFISV